MTSRFLPAFLLALPLFTVACSSSGDDTATNDPDANVDINRAAHGGSAGGSMGGAVDDAGATPSQDDAASGATDGSVAKTDGAAPPPPGNPPPGGSPGTSGWLSTQGNHIVTSDGKPWHGRGANVHDSRSCNACVGAPNADESIRRIDELVDHWHANFLRLVLESNDNASTVVNNASYLADVKKIVDHIGTKPGVYVQVSLWIDPTETSMGWPTNPATVNEWKKLATTFAQYPYVLFGLVNEPTQNYDGSLDSQVWDAMNMTVDAIRVAEGAAGAPHPHIVSVQGTGGWARRLDYYVTHPITAGGGKNVAYEVHVYDPQSTFAQRFGNPSKTIPVIIGEYGPVNGGGATMSLADVNALIDQARQLEIPHLAWTFHMRCPPNLLVDHSNGGCGVNMPLEPTPDWGVPLKQRLAEPW